MVHPLQDKHVRRTENALFWPGRGAVLVVMVLWIPRDHVVGKRFCRGIRADSRTYTEARAVVSFGMMRTGHGRHDTSRPNTNEQVNILCEACMPPAVHDPIPSYSPDNFR